MPGEPGPEANENGHETLDSDSGGHLASWLAKAVNGTSNVRRASPESRRR